MSVYGPRSASQSMIAGVVRMHGKIHGLDEMGRNYSANDPELLTWVQSTAAFGFSNAYDRFVRPLSAGQFDQFYLEGYPLSVLYGATAAAQSRAELTQVFDRMEIRLQPSDCIFEFLRIMTDSAAFPRALRPMQRLLVRAGVELVPANIRRRLSLSAEYGLPAWQHSIARAAGWLTDRIVLPHSPAAQACLRLGYPVTHLYDESRENATQVTP
jgi:uncharacterized protein (DUF2236 family)